jgi:hypothetical protein
MEPSYNLRARIAKVIADTLNAEARHAGLDEDVYDASEFYSEADAVLKEITGDPEAAKLAMSGSDYLIDTWSGEYFTIGDGDSE